MKAFQHAIVVFPQVAYAMAMAYGAGAALYLITYLQDLHNHSIWRS
jgi:hypothetical protein